MASLLTNPIVIVLGLIGGVCSVIAIPLSVVLYFKSKKEKRPRFIIESNNIILGLSNAIPDLKITYSGHGPPLSNFTVTRLYFWNDGRETITKQDVARNDVLTITINDPFRILDATIVYATSKANNIGISVNREKKDIALTFDYLDHGDGTVLQIIHDGTSNSDLNLLGSIKGCGKPERVYTGTRIGPLVWITVLLFASAIVLPYVLEGIRVRRDPLSPPLRHLPGLTEVLMLVATLGNGLLGLLVGKWSANRIKRVLPKNLRDFTRHPLNSPFRRSLHEDDIVLVDVR
jgi:hypothetical protein